MKSKRGLYRALLRRVFSVAGERMRAIAAADATPTEKVDRVIAGFAELIRDHASVPGIMLREVAEAGVHLDRETLAALAGVPRAVAGIIHEGIERGEFRDVNPVFTYFSILAPIVMFTAAAPIRQEVEDLQLVNLARPSPSEFVRHMQAAQRRVLARDVLPE